MTKHNFKKHFKLNMFSLDYHNPLRFVHGPWGMKKVGGLFLFYRIIIALTMISIVLWSMISKWSRGKWFIFLSNWGFLALSLQYLFGALLVMQAYKKQKYSDYHINSNISMPLSYKTYWLIYNISLANAFYISIMYWIFVHNSQNMESIFSTIVTHAGNIIVAIVDLILGGPPLRILHAFQPLAFGLCFVAFTIIFWAVNGTNPNGEPWIYSVLNWNRASHTTMMVIISAILIVSLHVLLTGIAGIRCLIANKMCAKNQKPSFINEMWNTNQTSETQQALCSKLDQEN